VSDLSRWLGLALLAAGCSNAAHGGGDAGGGPDLAPPMINLTGMHASDVELAVTMQPAGGAATTGTLKALAQWNAFQTPNPDGTVGVTALWHPCSVPVPSAFAVDYDAALATYAGTTLSNETLSSSMPGATLTQNTVPFVVGACVSHLATDPLPADATNLCPVGMNTLCDGPGRGCVLQTKDAAGTVWPGVPVPVSGLSPDVDTLYVSARVTFALSTMPTTDGSESNGAVSAGTYEWHILACHLRAGGACTAQQVAALEAAKPAVTVTGGSVRTHYQPGYFTCPQFLSDPVGAVTGLEMFPPDGGTTDALSTMSFSSVQSDLDWMGCATGGCHETRTAPGQMHLVYRPQTDALKLQNYQQSLPWTTAPMKNGSVLPGGRFTNEVPLPADMHTRWVDWIGLGAPF
jgi:hypothetical protein